MRNTRREKFLNYIQMNKNHFHVNLSKILNEKLTITENLGR